MPRFLLSLLLSAPAFAAAWWAGSVPPSRQPSPVPASASMAAAPASGEAGASGPAFGFAHREARLRRLEITDIPSIRRLLETSPPDAHGVEWLIQAWAERDAAGLWRWLESGGGKVLEGHEVSRILFEAWFRQDPEAAIAAFRKAGAMRRKGAVSGLLHCLVNSPDAGLAVRLTPYLNEMMAAAHFPAEGFGGGEKDTVFRLAKLPPGTGRDTLLSSAAEAWLAKDWKSATAWISAQAEPLKSKIMESAALAALAPGFWNNAGLTDAQAEHFDWAAEWFNTGASDGFRLRLGPRYVNTLARRDPAAALEWARSNLTSRPLAKAVSAALREQSLRDPAATRGLVESLPPGALRERAAFAVVTQPDAESVTWLMGMVEKKEAAPWHGIAANWSFADPAAYKKFLESAAPGDLPPQLVIGGVDNLLRWDAPGTMEWMLGTGNSGTAGYALESWGRSNPPAAAAWLRDHRDRDWREETLRSFALQYFQRAADDAAAWAVSLPPGAARDITTATMRRFLAGDANFEPERRKALEARLDKGS